MTRPLPRSTPRPQVLELRTVFGPLALVALLYVPILILYVVSSASVFGREFESRKALSGTGLLFFVLALGAFAAGAMLGQRGATRRRDDIAEPAELGPIARRRLAVLVEVALWTSVAAYVLWFGLGIVRAGGPAQLFTLWRTDPHEVKASALATVPGVTTFTQLAVAAVPLAVAFGLARPRTVVRALVIVVIALAAVRSVVVSERLALVELVVPLVFVTVARRRIAVPRIIAWAGVFVATVMLLFAVTELRRTYVYTNDFSPAASATRFFGYYLTSVNNGMAVIDDFPGRTPFYSVAKPLWELPGLGQLRLEHLPVVETLSFRYTDAFGVEPGVFWPRAFAASRLDYEFNVFTAPGFLAADLGWAALAAMLVIGLVSGRLFARSGESTLHRAAYGVWLVGLLELMRILYATDTRLVPAYALFVAAFLVIRRRPVTRAASTDPRARALA